MNPDSSPADDDAVIRDAVEGRRGGDELSLHLQALRDELTGPPDPQTRWNHVAAMRRAAPVATPTRVRRSTRSVVAVAAATVGVVVLTTGLAAAGRLPGGAQDRFARLAEVVGVDLPGNDQGTDSRPSDGVGGNARTTRTDRSEQRTGAEPDVVATIPGAAGTPPGSSGTAPGLSSAPGQSGSAPGRSGSAPGQTGTTPGQPGSTPGTSGGSPGQSGASPGKSGDAPGQTDDAPGKSGSAPGRAGDGPGSSSLAPGHTKVAPSTTTSTVVVPESGGAAG